ncbi:NrtR DNA-binding winged helix domain-containing protein [Microbacter margulisiae]|uniref:ADP-ribose pyrophosphatase YjhB (NUDIX family) n=1 Tax=Microbacter margulisiae TaxID=1350067 RepID=A0A7W5DPH2_9PORP|nr:NUDIX domain-containing protein [Microbacter margulisiae]MBB3186689.1 ADP-ribose pyrophosphatase YjhB (NUDIX family) [Microbacter margulisiae]
MPESTLYPHVSVDCVIFGFTGEKLNILLISRSGINEEECYNDMKLPGSVIYENEDLDDAAYRVLHELTGIKNIYLQQFHSFGSPERTKNPQDIVWLENAIHMKIGRIVTIGYVALIKIGQKLQNFSDKYEAHWCDINNIGQLAFDHNIIVEKALDYVRLKLEDDPIGLYELLPKRFTEAELRNLHEIIFGTKVDIRNFHKKFLSLHYVVPLDEKQENVAHRAARYYRFDKIIYNQIHR